MTVHWLEWDVSSRDRFQMLLVPCDFSCWSQYFQSLFQTIAGADTTQASRAVVPGLSLCSHEPISVFLVSVSPEASADVLTLGGAVHLALKALTCIAPGLTRGARLSGASAQWWQLPSQFLSKRE